MATKKRSTINEEPVEGTPMYILIDPANAFDPSPSVTYPTEEAAAAKAHELLRANPGRVLTSAKLLKKYKATVQIDETEVGEGESDSGAGGTGEA